MGSLRIIVAALASAAIVTPAAAERIVALTAGNGLVLFDSATPTNTGSVRAITGLGGQDLVGIDVRPATDTLYGLGRAGGIFTISLAGGDAVATQVATLSVSLIGTNFGIDFNPVPDRLRVVSDADQNLRINVADGVAIVDGALAYDAADVNAGANPNVTAVAYTNSFTPSPRTPPPGTQLFYLDATLNILATTTMPNAGLLTTVGGAGNPMDISGFDISGATGSAFAAWSERLFAINLAGGATNLGFIGSGDLGIEDIAIAPTVTPAPAALTLFGLGALALLRRRTR